MSPMGSFKAMRLNKIMQSNWAFTIVVACSLLLSIPFWTSASNIIVPSSGLTPSGYYLTDGTNFFLPPFMSLVTKPVQGNFSWVNQGTATDTVTNGGLVLHVIQIGRAHV